MASAQSLAALGRANKIRLARARLKADIRAGRIDVIDIITSPPEYADGMKLYALLTAMPRVGRRKADLLMSRTLCSGGKTVGELTDRQRGLVVELIRTKAWLRAQADRGTIDFAEVSA